MFFSIFGCTHERPEQLEHEASFLYFSDCCLKATQIFLTNLNYSLICNDIAHKSEVIVYQMVLFAEIIFNGLLLIHFIQTLQEIPKDQAILYTSLIIANQIMIMDLIFRATFEQVQYQKKIFQKYFNEEENQQNQYNQYNQPNQQNIQNQPSIIKINLAKPSPQIIDL